MPDSLELVPPTAVRSHATRRRVIQAGVWAAPAIALATAAPAAASTSYVPPTLTGELEFIGACTISAQGTIDNAHITAAWDDGLVITINGGDPDTAVPPVTLVATFTDAGGDPVNMIGEAQMPPSLSFVAPATVGFVAPSIGYLLSTIPAPTFDSSGTYSLLITGTLRIGNDFFAPVASLPHGGSFHLQLVVGGQLLAIHDQLT